MICLRLLIILQLCLLLNLSQNCPNSIDFNYSSKSCAFSYNYVDQNCTEFNFVQCSWIECIKWKRVNNKTVCELTRVFYHSEWNHCTQLCCDSDVIYPYSYDSIQQCQKYLDELQKKTLIIVFSIIGGIALIVLICVLYKKYSALVKSGCLEKWFKPRRNKNNQRNDNNDLRVNLSVKSEENNDTSTPW